MKIWPFFAILFLIAFFVFILSMVIIGVSDDVFIMFVLAMLIIALVMGFFYFVEEVL